jgi:hypothetical protein
VKKSKELKKKEKKVKGETLVYQGMLVHERRT